jgi:hypothetical protein
MNHNNRISEPKMSYESSYSTRKFEEFKKVAQLAKH